jgi:hypothetical protein
MTEICFWCKRAKFDSDTGQPVYRDYEFCATCLRAVEHGIAFIQVTGKGNGNPEIRDGLYPTGHWVVVTEENVARVLTDTPLLDKVLSTRQMYVNESDWKSLKLP